MPFATGSDDPRKFTAIGFVFRIWEERLFLAVLVALFVALATVYAFILPPKYSATLLIGHVSSVESPGASGSLGLGGAMSLLGGRSREDPKFDLFLTLIKTEDFGRTLERQYHLVEQAPKDERLKSTGQLLTLLNSIAVVPDSDSGTAKLTVQTRNKDFAKYFLAIVYKEGNQAVRKIDTERAKSFAAYIEDRFTSESNRSLQDALGTLLMTQERFLMVTSVNLPYAAQLLDGPNVSERPTSPRTFLIIAIGFVVGFAFSLIAVVLWDAVITERYERGLETPTLSEWLSNIRYVFGGQKQHQERNSQSGWMS